MAPTRRASRPWTHPSVKALDATDPVEAITANARRVVFEAMEKGWSGPPFDPIRLAEFLGVETHPTQEVFDARALTEGGRPRIDYNPNRPRARIRFSVAHEIGHTFFPDFADRARHRGAVHERTDDWQLEMLCNLAAAELVMPVGSFPGLDRAELSIDRLLDLRAEFEVSMEATLLRAVRLTDVPVLAFAAARHAASTLYQIDYAVLSRTTVPASYAGSLLPPSSAVAQCSGVGVTAKSIEKWDADGRELIVEAVGIAPYPQSSVPRVVGLRMPTRGQDSPFPELAYLRGDATSPRGSGRRLVAQIVNDRTPRWGGGFALSVRRRWPHVQNDFIAWVAGRRIALGSAHLAQAESDVWVFSIVAQHGYGPSASPRIRYWALERGFEELARIAERLDASVHFPRIGAGQAGGNWSVIAGMLTEQLLTRRVAVTVYDPPGFSSRLSRSGSGPAPDG